MIKKPCYLEKILVSPKKKKIDYTAIKLYMIFVNFCTQRKIKYFETNIKTLEEICLSSKAVAKNKLKILEKNGLILIRDIGINNFNQWYYGIEMLNRNQRKVFLKSNQIQL
jgi:hypothetical protein